MTLEIGDKIKITKEQFLDMGLLGSGLLELQEKQGYLVIASFEWEDYEKRFSPFCIQMPPISVEGTNPMYRLWMYTKL